MTSVLLGFVGLLLLFFGGELLVRGASGLALRFGLSPLAIGLTVVALGTSAPELLVSLDAAFSGANDISIGNVVGSNTFNILGVLGLTAVVHPLESGDIRWLDLGLMTGLAILLGVLLWHRLFLTRVHGAILLIVFVAYTVWRLS